MSCGCCVYLCSVQNSFKCMVIAMCDKYNYNVLVCFRKVHKEEYGVVYDESYTANSNYSNCSSFITISMGGESRPLTMTDLAERLLTLRPAVDMLAYLAVGLLLPPEPAPPDVFAVCSLMAAWLNAPPADIIESGMVMYWLPPSVQLCARIWRNPR